MKANRSNRSGGNVYFHIIFEVFGDVSGGPVVDAEVRLVAVDGIDGTSNHECNDNSTRGTHDRRRRVSGAKKPAIASVFFSERDVAGAPS